jgi:GDPmannose 4,6-dehydratase
MELEWEGEGVGETGRIRRLIAGSNLAGNIAPGQIIVKVDPRYFRPTEVETLLGDPSKAKAKLGWQPRISFPTLVEEMAQGDLELAEREMHIRSTGFKVHRRWDA